MSVRDDRRYYITPYLNTVKRKNNKCLLDLDQFIPLDSGLYSKSMGKKRKERKLFWNEKLNKTTAFFCIRIEVC